MNRRRTSAAAICLALTASAAAQHVKIDRCEPAEIASGTATEITLHGRNLERAELWTSFPATVERLDEKAPKFRITTAHTGTGALRAYTNQGTSNLSLVRIAAAAAEGVVASEKKARHEEAQAVTLPCVVEGSTDNLASSFYRFSAQAGRSVAVAARARGSDFDGVLTVRDASGRRRLAFADDDEVTGADPQLLFTPPADGEFVLELSDSQFRGGKRFELRIGGEPPRPPAIASTDDPFVSGLPATISGCFDGAEPDLFSFEVPASSFLTITPKARSIASAATLRLKLADKDGKVLTETPRDAFDERVLRVKTDSETSCSLVVEDAFGRSGERYFYQIEVSTAVPPFALSIPREGDKNKPLRDNYLATPGGVFRVPVQVQRHAFDAAIDLSVDGWALEESQIAAGQGGTDLRVRVPDDAEVGGLRTFRVDGSAQGFAVSLQSGDALRQRLGGVEIPAEIDGQLAVQIVASPLDLEVAPPAGAKPDSSVKVPVKLRWKEEGQKFNTRFKVVGTPPGVDSPEQSLKPDEGTERELELKIGKDVTELRELRVEVGVEYFGQTLWLQSAPFSIKLELPPAADENKDA